MNKVLLGIGSNTDACFNIKLATDYLQTYFPTIKIGNAIVTAPHGAVYTTPFKNALAYLETDLSKDEVEIQLKTIEKNMGRLPSHKTEGVVIIDLDLIQWNNQILKPDDFKRDYMQELMLEMQHSIDNQ